MVTGIVALSNNDQTDTACIWIYVSVMLQNNEFCEAVQIFKAYFRFCIIMEPKFPYNPKLSNSSESTNIFDNFNAFKKYVFYF